MPMPEPMTSIANRTRKTTGSMPVYRPSPAATPVIIRPSLLRRSRRGGAGAWLGPLFGGASVMAPSSRVRAWNSIRDTPESTPILEGCFEGIPRTHPYIRNQGCALMPTWARACDDNEAMADQQILHEPDEIPVQRMTRPMDGRLVAGVAQALAGQLKLDPVVIRLTFVLLSVVDGIGVIAYAILWMVTPQVPHEKGAPVTRDWSQLAAFTAIGMALTAFSWLTGASNGGIGILPFAVCGIGAMILWQQADPERRRHWMTGATKGMRKNRIRTLVGVILVVVGAIGFLYAQNELFMARPGLLFTLVVVGGLAIIATPWLAGLWKELQIERRERIRQEERAEVAAHVHDSVLHTLTLIQRAAHDQREVTRLARAQERELRNWLYQPKQDADASLAAAVRRIAAEEEDAHGVPIEIVCVGDVELDEGGRLGA